MTSASKYYFVSAMLIAAVVASTIAAYPYLPTLVPTHWDAQGHVNGMSPRWTLFVLNPGIMALTLLIFWALPWLSPKQFQVESFRSTALYIMVAMLALLTYVHALILAASLSWMLDVGRAVEGGICLLLALMGNVMGKVRRNFFIGIRTPWTLASEPVWNATHRFAGKTLFIGGIVGLLAVILHAPFWLPIVAIVTATLIPVIYSLVFYKQLERKGAL
jgi:uncharacterized membrane protein